MAAFLLVNGPNLNLLGSREPEVYGVTRLEDIEANCIDVADELGHTLECFQSNAEHKLIDRIQKAGRDNVDFIIINPGAFTHTSVALRVAISAVGLPVIEAHLSNIHARESFRQHSYVAGVVVAQVAGFGAMSYHLALRGLVARLSS